MGKVSYTKRDMSGMVVVITGATRGIGLEAAKGIATTGAEMIVVGRSDERLDALVAELESIEGHGSIHPEKCDLLSQREVHDLAKRIEARVDRLDVLVNNAGAIFTKRIESEDGFERTWALNHNAYFLLTSLLKDMLVKTPGSRVVNTASDAHKGGKMRWSDLQYERKGMRGGWSPYCQSKLANVLFTRELARKLEGTDTTANCIHPGFVNTGFSRNNGSLGRLMMLITWPVQRNSKKGAEGLVYLTTSEEAASLNGEYLYNCKPHWSTRASRDLEAASRLWELSLEMTDTSSHW